MEKYVTYIIISEVMMYIIISEVMMYRKKLIWSLMS